MAASLFKARCLRVLDDVARTGERVIILKRGKPVAELIPFAGDSARDFPQQGLAGSIVTSDDLLSPALPEEAWDALGEP